MKKIHFVGAVRAPRIIVLAGWAACCSGAKAERIRAGGWHTLDVSEVTCMQCLRLMAKDPRISQRMAEGKS